MDNNYIENLCKNSKLASKELSNLGIREKNIILNSVASEIVKNTSLILEKNKKDIDNAKNNNVKSAFIERLTLTKEKVIYMAKTLEQIAKLDDVVNQYDYMKTLENGLVVGKKRVPLGVILLIFESRPNMIVDSFSICLKTGNAVILRGGKEAIGTNIALTNIIQQCLINLGYNKDFITLVTDTSRQLVPKLVKQNKYIDVVIPRGSSSLINAVIKDSTVPVIETGIGNCHVYIDKDADFEKALTIINNAKTHRVSVCNSCESLLIHKDVCEKYLPAIEKLLLKNNVEFLCCENSLKYIKSGKLATDEDFHEEFLDYIISVKVVDSIDMAINHIDNYGTKHSEAIVSENYSSCQKFLREVDASTVYVNASTRFTDGDEFGFGGEIGISTQKLHARGPMGLKEMTTYKYVVYGEGQVRS